MFPARVLEENKYNTLASRPRFDTFPERVASESGVELTVARQIVTIFENTITKGLLSGWVVSLNGIGVLASWREGKGSEPLLGVYSRMPECKSFKARRMSHATIRSITCRRLMEMLDGKDTEKKVAALVERMWKGYLRALHHFYRNVSGVRLGEAGILYKSEGPQWVVSQTFFLKLKAGWVLR